MRYFVKKKSLKLLLIFFDRILVKARSKKTKKIRKILICNTAHLGDLINAHYLIAPLRKKYPQAQIGILVHPNSKDLICNVDRIHTILHYKHCRSTRSLAKKVLTYWHQLFFLIKELRQEKYEISIDSYLYFGNSSFITYLAQIPIRIGFASGGFGKLYTHPYHPQTINSSVVRQYQRLLNQNGIPWVKSSHFLNTKESLINPKNPYLVIHPGCGKINRIWPKEHWIEVLRYIRDKNIQIVFTGQGDFESNLIRSLMTPEDLNLCNALTLPMLCDVINKSKGVLGGDSVAVHIAGAQNVFYIQIMPGMQPSNVWKVFSKNGVSLKENLHCSPCFLSNGCPSMDCIKKIHPFKVTEQLSQHIFKQ